MMLSTLLHELDGAENLFFLEKIRNRIYGWLKRKLPEKDWHVFVFGSTNRPEVLDPALIRSGRLSRAIKIDLPDRAGRRDILKGYLGRIKADADVSLDILVDEVSEVSPADIKVLITEEAPRKAVFDKAKTVKMEHVVSALREVQAGLKNPISDLDPHEREQIAVHESGHAILSWILTEKRLSTATIVRYGDSLGHVFPKETRQRAVRSLNEIWADLVVSIGGRAAEIVVYGEPLASVGGDYPHVMQRIEQLLNSGMWGTPIGTERENSVRIRGLFDAALEQAKELLSNHRGLHWSLVQALLTKDELDHEGIASLLGERPKEHIKLPLEPTMRNGGSQ
jgi:cell division protease FtsH